MITILQITLITKLFIILTNLYDHHIIQLEQATVRKTLNELCYSVCISKKYEGQQFKYTDTYFQIEMSVTPPGSLGGSSTPWQICQGVRISQSCKKQSVPFCKTLMFYIHIVITFPRTPLQGVSDTRWQTCQGGSGPPGKNVDRHLYQIIFTLQLYQ